MTIRAYPEIYLNKAQSALGDAFDYAINVCRIPGPDFIKLFIIGLLSFRVLNKLFISFIFPFFLLSLEPSLFSFSSFL